VENPVKGAFRPGFAVAITFLHTGAAAGLAWVLLQPVAPAVWVMAGLLYLASLVGISVGYHRHWTHQAFRCPKPVQYVLAVLGAIAAEGPLCVPPELRAGTKYAGWVKDHLQHHAYTEKDGDPHSPRRWGFLWAHMRWLFYETLAPAGWRPTSRLDNDPVVRWQYRWYWYLVVVGFALPTAVGFLLGGWSVAVQALLIAGFLRTVVHLHVTWCVNSVAHIWGRRAVDAAGRPYTDDDSRNVLWLGLISLGEGFHGTHHADPNSAWFGSLDAGWRVIRLLESCGLATAVRPFAPRPPR